MSESNENSKKDNKYLIHRQKCKRNSNENIRIENESDKNKNKETITSENSQKNPESQKPNNIYNSYISTKPTTLNYYSDVKNNQSENNIEKKGTNNSLSLSVNNLSNNNDKLSISISGSNYQFDKEFLSPVLVKKENILLTDSQYITFENRYGENSCYFNVILQLLYNFDEIYEYLLSLYQIDESIKKNGEKDNNQSQNQRFLVMLGKIMNECTILINEKKDKQVNMVKTSKIRKYLEQISNAQFPMNNIADPVELLTFIFDILNDFIKEDLHKNFYLELIDEFYCCKCKSTIKNEYDKDNFIYHIYIDEILNDIDSKNIKINEYKNKFFKFTKEIYKKDKKKCEKCQEKMMKDLICNNSPHYLLINCVWKVSNPILDDVVKFLFLFSLKDDLNNLFLCNIKKRMDYYLFAVVLYSFTLCHYVIVMFNQDNHVFVLYDDENVKEFNDLNDLIVEITVNILKKNGRAFFYPVMLVYTNEKIYDNRDLKFNKLDDNSYQDIINRSNEAIYEYNEKNNLNEEQKISNYQEYINKQKSFDNKKINKKNSIHSIPKDNIEKIGSINDAEEENKSTSIKNENNKKEIDNLKEDLKEKSKSKSNSKSKNKNREKENYHEMEIEENSNFNRVNKRNSQIKEKQKEKNNLEEKYNKKSETQRIKKNNEIKIDGDRMDIEVNSSKKNNIKTKKRHSLNMEIENENIKEEKKEISTRETPSIIAKKLRLIKQEIFDAKKKKEEAIIKENEYPYQKVIMHKRNLNNNNDNEIDQIKRSNEEKINNKNDDDNKYTGIRNKYKNKNKYKYKSKNIDEEFINNENNEKENMNKTYKKTYAPKYYNDIDNNNNNHQKSVGKKVYYNNYVKDEEENQTTKRRYKNNLAKSTINGRNNEKTNYYTKGSWKQNF